MLVEDAFRAASLRFATNWTRASIVELAGPARVHERITRNKPARIESSRTKSAGLGQTSSDPSCQLPDVRLLLQAVIVARSADR